MKSDIIYEPHPVSAERKYQLRQQGLIIVDAIYKPKELIEQEAAEKAAAVQREIERAELEAKAKAEAEQRDRQAAEKAAAIEQPQTDPEPPAREEKQQPLSLGKRSGNR